MVWLQVNVSSCFLRTARQGQRHHNLTIVGNILIDIPSFTNPNSSQSCQSWAPTPSLPFQFCYLLLLTPLIWFWVCSLFLEYLQYLWSFFPGMGQLFYLVTLCMPLCPRWYVKPSISEWCYEVIHKGGARQKVSFLLSRRDVMWGLRQLFSGSGLHSLKWLLIKSVTQMAPSTYNTLQRELWGNIIVLYFTSYCSLITIKNL